MNIHLSIFVPRNFMDAQAYVGEVLARHGFSSVNPHTKDVHAIIQTDDGLGALIEVSVEEIEKQLHCGVEALFSFGRAEKISWSVGKPAGTDGTS